MADASGWGRTATSHLYERVPENITTCPTAGMCVENRSMRESVSVQAVVLGRRRIFAIAAVVELADVV